MRTRKGVIMYFNNGRKLLLVGLCGVFACSSPGGESSVDNASAAQSTAGNGEFIIRVLPTGEISTVDPILYPKKSAPFTHAFFGVQDVTSTSTLSQLEANTTVAEDSNDTAAYWVPALYWKGQPWHPGCSGSPLTCIPDTNRTYYVRAYYTTGVGSRTAQFPRATMVTGYPNAMSPPANSMQRVHYACGADTAHGHDIVTPDSAWPYTCSNFPDAAFDGVVMILDYPDCWNGNVSGTLNGERVVQYVDPNVKANVVNDLEYSGPKGCSASFPFRIPHLSVRVHTKIQNPSIDGSSIYPSSCAGYMGFPSCQTQSAPPPKTGPGSLGLTLSSGDWFTFHGQYIQAWNMGKVTNEFSTSPPPNQGTNGVGSLNDLTQDCLEAAKTCGFQPDGAGQYVGP